MPDAPKSPFTDFEVPNLRSVAACTLMSDRDGHVSSSAATVRPRKRVPKALRINILLVVALWKAVEAREWLRTKVSCASSCGYEEGMTEGSAQLQKDRLDEKWESGKNDPGYAGEGKVRRICDLVQSVGEGYRRTGHPQDACFTGLEQPVPDRGGRRRQPSLAAS